MPMAMAIGQESGETTTLYSCVCVWGGGCGRQRANQRLYPILVLGRPGGNIGINLPGGCEGLQSAATSRSLNNRCDTTVGNGSGT